MRITISIVYFFVLLTTEASLAQETHKIFLPKEGEVTQVNYATTVQVIILSSDKIYCYPGQKLDSGHIYSLLRANNFRQFLQKTKKQFGDSLLVIIKPALSASYSNTVDVLDEMSMNDIKKYAFVELTIEEKNNFDIGGADKTSIPNTIKTPSASSKETSPRADDEHIILAFRFDTSKIVFYSIESIKRSSQAKVAMSQPKLKNIIIKAQKLSSQQKKILTVIIKGDFHSNYNHFKPLIDALRASKIYNFQMITTPY